MNKIKLKENFYMYQFEPTQGILGQNIFVLFGKDKEVIIIDAGYKRHIKKILEEVKDHIIKHIILTHFHPDHSYGLELVKNIDIIGSEYGIKTLEYFGVSDNKLLHPTTVITKQETFNFHQFNITITPNKGHSDCGILIDIDNEYLVVGDDVISTNKGEAVLPYVASTIKTHINGLENILNHEGYTFLPSHGIPTKDIKNIKERKDYLDFLLTKNPSIEDFYKTTSIRFVNEKWHKDNLNKQ